MGSVSRLGCHLSRLYIDKKRNGTEDKIVCIQNIRLCVAGYGWSLR